MIYLVLLLFVQGNIQTNTSNSVNTNLLNGVMLIHPNILYVLYALLLVSFLYYLRFSKLFLIKNSKYQNNNRKQFFFVVLTLFLGGYWAEQELFWGGY